MINDTGRPKIIKEFDTIRDSRDFNTIFQLIGNGIRDIGVSDLFSVVLKLRCTPRISQNNYRIFRHGSSVKYRIK